MLSPKVMYTAPSANGIGAFPSSPSSPKHGNSFGLGGTKISSGSWGRSTSSSKKKSNSEVSLNLALRNTSSTSSVSSPSPQHSGLTLRSFRSLLPFGPSTKNVSTPPMSPSGTGSAEAQAGLGIGLPRQSLSGNFIRRSMNITRDRSASATSSREQQRQSLSTSRHTSPPPSTFDKRDDAFERLSFGQSRPKSPLGTRRSSIQRDRSLKGKEREIAMSEVIDICPEGVTTKAKAGGSVKANSVVSVTPPVSATAADNEPRHPFAHNDVSPRPPNSRRTSLDAHIHKTNSLTSNSAVNSDFLTPPQSRTNPPSTSPSASLRRLSEPSRLVEADLSTIIEADSSANIDADASLGNYLPPRSRIVSAAADNALDGASVEPELQKDDSEMQLEELMMNNIYQSNISIEDGVNLSTEANANQSADTTMNEDESLDLSTTSLARQVADALRYTGTNQVPSHDDAVEEGDDSEWFDGDGYAIHPPVEEEEDTVHRPIVTSEPDVVTPPPGIGQGLGIEAQTQSTPNPRSSNSTNVTNAISSHMHVAGPSSLPLPSASSSSLAIRRRMAVAQDDPQSSLESVESTIPSRQQIALPSSGKHSMASSPLQDAFRPFASTSTMTTVTHSPPILSTFSSPNLSSMNTPQTTRSRFTTPARSSNALARPTPAFRRRVVTPNSVPPEVHSHSPEEGGDRAFMLRSENTNGSRNVRSASVDVHSEFGYGSGSNIPPSYAVADSLARPSSSASNTRSSRPGQTEWLGPRTTKAFAAAGLLDFDREQRPSLSTAGGSESGAHSSRRIGYSSMRDYNFRDRYSEHPKTAVSEAGDYNSPYQHSPSSYFTSSNSRSPSDYPSRSPVLDFQRRRTRSGSLAATDSPTSTVSTYAPRSQSGSTAATSVSGGRSTSWAAQAGYSMSSDGEIQVLKEQHAAETSALLAALSDAQRTTRVLRQENKELWQRIEAMESGGNMGRREHELRERERDCVQREKGCAERERECQELRRKIDLRAMPPPPIRMGFTSTQSRPSFESTLRKAGAASSSRRTVPTAASVLNPSTLRNASRDSSLDVERANTTLRKRSSAASSLDMFPNLPSDMTMLLHDGQSGLGQFSELDDGPESDPYSGGESASPEHLGYESPSVRAHAANRIRGHANTKSMTSFDEATRSVHQSNKSIASDGTSMMSSTLGSPKSLFLRPEHELHLGDMYVDSFQLDDQDEEVNQ